MSLHERIAYCARHFTTEGLLILLDEEKRAFDRDEMVEAILHEELSKRESGVADTA